MREAIEGRVYHCKELGFGVGSERTKNPDRYWQDELTGEKGNGWTSNLKTLFDFTWNQP